MPIKGMARSIGGNSAIPVVERNPKNGWEASLPYRDPATRKKYVVRFVVSKLNILYS
jgi:hypothetical protein